jgi:hypothetical protein
MNKFAALLARILPRRTQAWAAGSMYRPREDAAPRRS